MDHSDSASREDLRVMPLEGYDPEVGRWLWALEDTRGETIRAVSGVTPLILDWAPPEGGNSIGSLLYHIALIEFDWVYTEVLESRDPPPAFRLTTATLRAISRSSLVSRSPHTSTGWLMSANGCSPSFVASAQRSSGAPATCRATT